MDETTNCEIRASPQSHRESWAIGIESRPCTAFSAYIHPLFKPPTERHLLNDRQSDQLHEYLKQFWVKAGSEQEYYKAL